MDKNRFSQSELQELEALEIRGGNGASSMAQYECSNNVKGCGNGVTQFGCTNSADGCGGSSEPPAQGPSCGIHT